MSRGAFDGIDKPTRSINEGELFADSANDEAFWIIRPHLRIG
jgi:hypothetical protein